MPKISVIIPNYNHARFLEQRIESILNQTFQDFEIIFLDDNSTDNSWEVFSKYATHPKISHAVVNETNSGSPFKQWNKGFSLATGEYIWIAESDDYSDLNFLGKLVPLMQSNVAIAYCRSVTVNEINEISDYFWADGLDDQRWKQNYLSEGLTEISDYLVFRNTIPNASSAIFRREWINCDLPLTQMRYAGDWLFWINLLKIKSRKIAYISNQLNYFRTHTDNTRSLRGYEKEIQRYEEYFVAIQKALNISGYSFLNIVTNKKGWAWIFEEFNTRKQIFPSIYNLLPPFIPIFILLYHEYNLLSFQREFIFMSKLFMLKLIHSLKKVLKSLRSFRPNN
jgi:glycosyltransferase involved in cell wall biosynthesis